MTLRQVNQSVNHGLFLRVGMQDAARLRLRQLLVLHVVEGSYGLVL